MSSANAEPADGGVAKWPADVDPETAAFFDRTIATWRCDGCGTEFTIDSVLAVMRSADLECPLCEGGEADLVRRGDHPERTEVGR